MEVMPVVRHIADRVLRLLWQQNLLLPPEKRRGAPIFYVWPRDDRAIIIMNVDALKDVDRVASGRFTHHLSTALGGRKVVVTNSRGLFIQIGYWPRPRRELRSEVLDLAKQPAPLDVPIGLTRRGPMWLPITEMDAVLIGGSRRMGKTNLLHGWIQALIRGGQARLFLWDGKGGAEFGRYRNEPGVTYSDDAGELLAKAGREMARRFALLQESGHPNAAAYNRERGKAGRLQPLVLITR